MPENYTFGNSFLFSSNTFYSFNFYVYSWNFGDLMPEIGLWLYIVSKGLSANCLTANYRLFLSFPTDLKYHLYNVSNSYIHTQLSPNPVFLH